MSTKGRKKSHPASVGRPAARIPMRTRAKSFLLGVAPIIALMTVVRIALAEPYHIPSGSMSPTLLAGDWLYVNKLRYGPHVPFTHRRLPGYAEPQRRDVVVFVSPPQDSAIRITPNQITPMLVKRVIGMPGDTLYMRGGALFINGVPEAPTLAIAPDPGFGSEYFSRQRALEIRGSRFGDPPGSPSAHDWGPLVVPSDSYFMLGDNRDSSVDSRFYGPVPRANIRGTPIFIYYSYDTEEGLDHVRAVSEIRWRRIGTVIR
jgi:signal peptidase I